MLPRIPVAPPFPPTIRVPTNIKPPIGPLRRAEGTGPPVVPPAKFRGIPCGIQSRAARRRPGEAPRPRNQNPPREAAGRREPPGIRHGGALAHRRGRRCPSEAQPRHYPDIAAVSQNSPGPRWNPAPARPCNPRTNNLPRITTPRPAPVGPPPPLCARTRPPRLSETRRCSKETRSAATARDRKWRVR